MRSSPSSTEVPLRYWWTSDSHHRHGKRGFSKRALAEAVGDVGIEYVHARELGNEKENRSGFGKLEGAAAEQARDSYRTHLSNGSTPAVRELLETIREQRVAVLCYEQDERYCHREVLIEHLQELEPGPISSPSEGFVQQADDHPHVGEPVLVADDEHQIAIGHPAHLLKRLGSADLVPVLACLSAVQPCSPQSMTVIRWPAVGQFAASPAHR